jgi:hypothetical protein
MKLRWRIKTYKINGKTYTLNYISIPSKLAIFLKNYEPYLDIENKMIIFKQRQENDEQNPLKWRIKSVKKKGKTLSLYYISIPGKLFSLLDLGNYEPYLDPENKTIIFRPRQGSTQTQSQNFT